MPEVPTFVRAEMYPSGFMIRSCQEGSIVVALDHMDLEVCVFPFLSHSFHFLDFNLYLQPWRVSDQIRPLYDSSASLAMRSTVEVGLLLLLLNFCLIGSLALLYFSVLEISKASSRRVRQWKLSPKLCLESYWGKNCYVSYNNLKKQQKCPF